MSKSLVAGAVALLLVFSGTPAYGQDASPGTEGEVGVAEETPNTPPESGDETTPGGEVPDQEGGDGSSPGSEPSSETDETNELATPAPSEPADPSVTNVEPDTGSEDAAVDDEAVTVDAPASIEVSGTIYVVPDEAAPQTLEQMTAGEPVEVQTGGAVVATDQAGLIPLDISNSAGELESGNTFEGEVVLPDIAVDAVQERLEDEGELTTAEVAETAVSAANEEGTTLVATGIGITADTPTAEVVSTRSHPIDVRYFGGSSPRPSPTQTQMRALVGTASTYWNGQTGAKISSMPVSSYATLRPAYDRCDLYGLWSQAIWDLGYYDANDYLNSGRHLVVFVNQGCGGANGVGTIGSLHSGGVTWIDLGERGSGIPVSDAGHALAHELGHNLGLGHSNARTCVRPKVDAKSSTRTGLPGSGSGCADSEYGDLWSVMGGAATGYGAKPAALTIAQKKMLGLTSSSSLKGVSPSGGLVQSFTLQAASATSGIRGLRVASPSPGQAFFVEYRNGTGQDSGMPWASGDWWTGGSFFSGNVGTGVRVLKATDTGKKVAGKRTTVLSQWSGSRRYQAIRSGQFITPYGNTVRAVVSSSSGSTATVKIAYRGFRDGGKSVSTKVTQGGALIAGKTLRASLTGKWEVTFGAVPAVSKTKERFQWLRNGKSIAGATKSSYRTTVADIGKSITVRVKPSATGWITGKGSVSSSKSVVSPPFVDVPYGHSSYKSISWVKSAGIFAGHTTSTGSTYRPKASISRAAMASFLYRMEAPAAFTAPSVSPFADVPTTHAYYTEIAWMYEMGAFSGVKKSGKRYLDPTARVTHSAMAKYLYRLADASVKGPRTSPFADVKTTHAYYDEIAWISRTGIWKGVPQKSGKPKFQASKKLTREEMAVFMYRFTH